MSYCLLCELEYTPKVDFESLFLFKKVPEKKLCLKCLDKFEKLSLKRCHNCSKPGADVEFCQDCQRWQKLYAGKTLANCSIFKYNQALHDLMVNYKRYGDYVLYQVLVELIADQIPAADYYVPVPTSKSHFDRRRFDTIREIFQNLVPLTKILAKVDDGSAQGEKNRQERLQTKQSFYVAEKVSLEGKILLLDDIYTTGRTLYHARDALAEAYPNAQIKSFTIAR